MNNQVSPCACKHQIITSLYDMSHSQLVYILKIKMAQTCMLSPSKAKHVWPQVFGTIKMCFISHKAEANNCFLPRIAAENYKVFSTISEPAFSTNLIKAFFFILLYKIAELC